MSDPQAFPEREYKVYEILSQLRDAVKRAEGPPRASALGGLRPEFEEVDEFMEVEEDKERGYFF